MAMTAAGTTIEALMHGLRQGVQELAQADTLGRLLELDDQQLSAVIVRLQNFMPHIARAWTPDEIAVLIATRNTALGRTGATPALPKE
jgi:hypothetical protein